MARQVEEMTEGKVEEVCILVERVWNYGVTDFGICRDGVSFTHFLMLQRGEARGKIGWIKLGEGH